MDLLLLSLIFSITFSAAQGVTPRCCVEIAKKIPKNFLRQVTRYDVQNSRGVCAIDALILYVNDKRYCATPKLERFMKWILRTNIRKKRLSV